MITQPAIYVDLEMSLGVSKVLTLEKMEGIAEFGSTFKRNTRWKNSIEKI